jgi:hypothetical protein
MPGSPAVRQLLMTNNLRRLLVNAASKPDPKGVSSALRPALREICESADFRTEHPERLLIAFKLSLTEAANDANISPGPERTRLLDQVVTLYIEELYRASEDTVDGSRDGRQLGPRNSIPSRNPGLNGARP